MSDIVNNEDSDRAATQNNVYIDQLHLNENDISAIRKLAETDPKLAHKLIDNQKELSVRKQNSHRMGLTLSALLAIVGLAGSGYVIVNIGWWQSIVFVSAMLGMSHLLRVILTGEWSDTSWFGKLLSKKPNHDNKD